MSPTSRSLPVPVRYILWLVPITFVTEIASDQKINVDFYFHDADSSGVGNGGRAYREGRWYRIFSVVPSILKQNKYDISF